MKKKKKKKKKKRDSLRNCFYHPLLLTSDEKVFYLPRCMLVIQFSTHIDHKTNLSQNHPTWIKTVQNSGCQGLIDTLNHRTYGSTDFEWFRFGRNCYNHGNDPKENNGIIEYSYKNLYQLTKELDNVFPDMLERVHTYMSEHHLYHEFEGRETSDSVMMSICSKMEKLSRDLQNIQFVDFLEMIDMLDFVLGKVSVHCSNSKFMESTRNTIMKDKKIVCDFVGGFVGKTLSGVGERVKTKKTVKASLYKSLRYVAFLTRCLLNMMADTRVKFTLHAVVLKTIYECRDSSTFPHYKNLVNTCGLTKIEVIQDILKYKNLNEAEKTSFATKVSDLWKLVEQWLKT